ncbi:MAG: hypothetical protein A3I09_03965 [Deltaproteobacteria bacterium RIFCSPLOWO2_02_FULL_47_10]|nr:MAG: hypothetical protein A3I09_03965 [Deltaproteobacteria bacterium RIFCSPLOWO2_02_FULL_47_10]
MKLVTSSQMRALDEAAIKGGIPSLDLMERAGKGVAELVKKKFPKKDIVSVVSGKGNNGGDGLVAARHLAKAGYNVQVYLLSPWSEFSPDARTNWERLAGLNVSVHEDFSDVNIKKASCIVDAILGTGLTNDVTGRYRAAIEFINSLLKPVVSVDIPSGLSADTGEPLGVAIRAKYTVTFGLAKLGLFTGSEYAREVTVIDIGIPEKLIKGTGYNLVEPSLFAGFFGERPRQAHKGDFGHLLVIGGSTGKIGAGLLACRGGLRVGTGLVTYALPASAYVKFDTKSPEIMYEGLSDNGKGIIGKEAVSALRLLFQNKDAASLGPGIGTSDDTKKAVCEIIRKVSIPLVLDADGLNCLAGNMEALKDAKQPLVLTPHQGEMSRLTGLDIKEIKADRVGVAKSFAKKYHVYTVLKGHRTVTATPDGNIFINPTGNPGMASAGMGDVLTGVIGGLIAQKIPVETSVVAGVYLHGLAGDIASSEIGERGLVASDVINALPRAIETIGNQCKSLLNL